MPYKYLLTACLLLGGCDQIKSIVHDETKQDSTVPQTKIGVLISNATANPFFANAYQAFQQYGTDHDGITVVTDDANDDQQKQFAALDQMIAAGVQAIVINMVDATQAQTVIDKAKLAGIPVVFFNRSPGEDALFSYDKALFVDGDAVQGGVLQGLDVLDHWRTHPEWDKDKDGVIDYAMLMGIPGNPSAEARTKWSVSTMNSYPKLGQPVRKIALEPALFREQLAYDAVNKWIDNGKIDKIEVILANNDTMAMGAAKALKAAQKTVPVFGIDAVPAALAMVQSGELAGTVVNDAAAQAETSLLAAANLAHQRPVTTGIDNRVDYQTILVPYRRVEDQ